MSHSDVIAAYPDNEHAIADGFPEADTNGLYRSSSGARPSRLPGRIRTTSLCRCDLLFSCRRLPRHYPASDAQRRLWYATPLARLGEPSLSCGHAVNAQSYRLLWLNSQAHPVVIRITRTEDVISLHAFQLSGWGATDPGRLTAYSHRRLTEAEWRRLQAALIDADFWRLPTSGNLYGIHGGQWVIEGNDRGRYHLVDR